MTALMMASAEGHLEVERLLLECGTWAASKNSTTLLLANSLFHVAVRTELVLVIDSKKVAYYSMMLLSYNFQSRKIPCQRPPLGPSAMTNLMVPHSFIYFGFLYRLK